MKRLDVEGTVVVGAGVIGLAVARALALEGRPVWVLESEADIGRGVSSRSSEVLHAGLYHPPDSLKARCCVRGRRLLSDYLVERQLPHHVCGKLIVASAADELEALEALRRNAEANGVSLRLVSSAERARMEPEVRCVAALHSPESGIFDAHALLRALADDLRAHGGEVVFEAPLLDLEPDPSGWRLSVGGREPATVRCRSVVVAAGLEGRGLVERLLPQGFLPPAPRVLAKGNYFRSGGAKSPFRRLIYPLPEPGGLGIHATLDLSGQVRFGPDVEWVSDRDLRVDPGRSARFARAIRRYWPRVDEVELVPDYAGLRPKLVGPDAGFTDFVVSGEADHGWRGGVFLLGIESPGLTAALALAEQAVERLE